MTDDEHPAGRDWVAIVLAVGVAVSLNSITFAIMWDALRSDTPGLSENATQVITGAFGAILGVLGSYLGFRAGAERLRKGELSETSETEDPPGSSLPGDRRPDAQN